jgi:CBS domain-containing protein
MLVADIMTAGPVTVRPEMAATVALRLLSERSVTALPVVTGDGRLVGIVSEADLLRASVADSDAAGARTASGPSRALALDRRPTVADLMLRRLVTVAPDQELTDAVGTMLENHVHSVPVVFGSRVVGVLSRSDVVRALASNDRRIVADLIARFDDARLDRWRYVVDEGRVRLFGGPACDVPLVDALARSVDGVRSVEVLCGTGGDGSGGDGTGGEVAHDPRPAERALWPI